MFDINKLTKHVKNYSPNIKAHGRRRIVAVKTRSSSSLPLYPIPNSYFIVNTYILKHIKTAREMKKMKKTPLYRSRPDTQCAKYKKTLKIRRRRRSLKKI